MKLGQYKGIPAEKPVIQIREQEILQVLTKKQKEHAVIFPVDGRSAKEGDQAILDFTGTLNGAPIQGGRSKDYPLVLGSHSFVPGFEEQVIGKHPGESFDIHVTFPENYHIKQLCGQPVVFHATLHKLYQPEYQPLDDDFARDFSEYSSIQEWKHAIRVQLTADREEKAFEKLSGEILTRIIDNSEIPVDDELKAEIARELYDDFLDTLQENHISLNDYCRQTGLHKEELMHHYEQDAVRSIQEQNVLHAVAHKENLEVTQAELEKELCAIAAEEGDSVSAFRDTLGSEELEAITDQLRMNKALKFVLENAEYHTPA